MLPITTAAIFIPHIYNWGFPSHSSENTEIEGVTTVLLANAALTLRFTATCGGSILILNEPVCR
jgi:hypothetical protein